MLIIRELIFREGLIFSCTEQRSTFIKMQDNSLKNSHVVLVANRLAVKVLARAYFGGRAHITIMLGLILGKHGMRLFRSHCNIIFTVFHILSKASVSDSRE